MKNIIAIIVVVFIIVLIFVVPRTDEDGAKSILESSGFSQVEITGFEPWMMGRDDFYSTGFTAKSPTGQIVRGSVTGGPFKGSTIRFK